MKYEIFLVHGSAGKIVMVIIYLTSYLYLEKWTLLFWYYLCRGKIEISNNQPNQPLSIKYKVNVIFCSAVLKLNPINIIKKKKKRFLPV